MYLIYIYRFIFLAVYYRAIQLLNRLIRDLTSLILSPQSVSYILSAPIFTLQYTNLRLIKCFLLWTPIQYKLQKTNAILNGICHITLVTA